MEPGERSRSLCDARRAAGVRRSQAIFQLLIERVY
jgi:hypothetical protein